MSKIYQSLDIISGYIQAKEYSIKFIPFTNEQISQMKWADRKEKIKDFLIFMLAYFAHSIAISAMFYFVIHL